MSNRRIFITFHAMSRAKQQLLKELKRADDAASGRAWSDYSLSRWLSVRANDAIDHGQPLSSNRGSLRFLHRGVVFVLSADLRRLATVYPHSPTIDTGLARRLGEHRGALRRKRRRKRRVEQASRDSVSPRRRIDPHEPDLERGAGLEDAA